MCNDEVIHKVIKDEENSILCTLLQLGSGATWGPLGLFPNTIVERAEYKRVWNSILSSARGPHPPRFLVRGTQGIGKSVFIYWLIYKLITFTREAYTKTEASPGAPVLESTTSPTLPTIGTNLPQQPTFLLLMGINSGEKVYYLLHYHSDGRPVVTSSRVLLRADYVLSDVNFDLRAAPRMFDMHVCSYGSAPTKEVSQAIMNARSCGGVDCEFTMGVCSFQELTYMLPGHSLPCIDFAYTIFGGSARHVCALVSAPPSTEKTESYEVVYSTMVEFIENSNFAGEEFAVLVDQSSKCIAHELDMLLAPDNSPASHAVYHSLFQHTSVTREAAGGVVSCKGWASAFMRELGYCIVEREDLSVRSELRTLLTAGGLGQLFERQVHKNLYRKFTKGGTMKLKRMYPLLHCP